MLTTKHIKYSVDTGSSYLVLLRTLQKEGYAEENIQKLVQDCLCSGLLTRGPEYPDQSGDYFMVVTEWMPNTAEKLRREMSPRSETEEDFDF